MEIKKEYDLVEFNARVAERAGVTTTLRGNGAMFWCDRVGWWMFR